MDFGNVFGPENNIDNPEAVFPEISGFDEFSELSNADVADFINNVLPPNHLENCSDIICAPNAPIWDEVPGAVGVHISSLGEPSIIAVAGGERLEGCEDTELSVLTHEIGHNAYDVLIANNPELAASWAELYQDSWNTYEATGLGFVSNYAQTNVFEDFAESYAMYVTCPELLKFMNPDKYEFMRDNVFDGREYAQVIDAEGNVLVVPQDMPFA